MAIPGMERRGARTAWLAMMIVSGLVGSAQGQGMPAPPPPEVYAAQPARQHSTLCDNTGKGIQDDTFAGWALRGLRPAMNRQAAQAGFYFNQCFGGGFLDDLHNVLDPTMMPWLGGAASRFDEFAYGQREANIEAPQGVNPNNWPMPRDGVGPFRIEDEAHGMPMSYYSRQLAPALGAIGGTQYGAALGARNTDPWGNMIRNNVRPFETGQIAFANGGHDIPLANGNIQGMKKAIIFAGLTDAMRHFNNVDQVFASLLAQGYAANDIQILYGDGVNRIINNGARGVLPGAWANVQPATANNLKNALQGLNLGPNDQFMFYATDHGGNTAIAGGAAIPGGGGSPANWQSQMSMLSQIRSSMSMTPENVPEFSLDYSGLSGEAELFFNGVSLGLIPESTVPTSWSIAVPEELIREGGLSNDIEILNHGSSFVVDELRLYSGAIPEFTTVPTPGTAALLGLGILTCRRRRRR